LHSERLLNIDGLVGHTNFSRVGLFLRSPGEYLLHFLVDNVRDNYEHWSGNYHKPEGRLGEEEEDHAIEFLLNGDEMEIDTHKDHVVDYDPDRCDYLSLPVHVIQAQDQFVTDDV